MLAVTEDKVRPATVLEEANTIIHGARAATHGKPEQSFTNIAEMWTAYLRLTHGTDWRGFTPEDVCWMMALLKLCRRQTGLPIRDHYVDAAGYVGLAAELGLPDVAQ